jgi:ring-1,2-phenylacetyl-CoA epoxidase subunit PaaC
MSVAATSRPDLTTPRAQVLLAIADDALISGHRSSHWTGVAPSLEEDLAFSTIAQDGINHADLWFQVLLGIAGDSSGPDARARVDALGLGRAPDDYRHAVLCEREPRDFAFTLARHWAYEHLDALRLDALTRSSDPDIAAVAQRLRHEARYHLEHADHWFTRLSGGGDDAHRRFGDALGVVLPEALGLFEPTDGEDDAVTLGLFPVGHPALRGSWLAVIGPRLREAGYGGLVPSEQDEAPTEASGGRRGRHTTDFTEDVWPEMTALYRAHPGARW